MPKNTKAGWAELLAAHVKSKEKLPEGPGWTETNELRAELKLGHRAYHRFIRSLGSSAEVFRGYRYIGNRIRLTTWYRIST